MGAISIREAAELLGVSYGTAYAHRLELGFFRVGAAWRIWPEQLKNIPAYNGNRPAPADKEKLCQSVSAETSTGLISAYQAEKELDALLARATERKRRNTTIR